MLPFVLYPGDTKGKGQQMNVTFTVALCDHVSWFVSFTCCIVPTKCRPILLGPRIVEWKQRITIQVPGTFSLPRRTGRKR